MTIELEGECDRHVSQRAGDIMQPVAEQGHLRDAGENGDDDRYEQPPGVAADTPVHQPRRDEPREAGGIGQPIDALEPSGLRRT